MSMPIISSNPEWKPINTSSSQGKTLYELCVILVGFEFAVYIYSKCCVPCGVMDRKIVYPLPSTSHHTIKFLKSKSACI